MWFATSQREAADLVMIEIDLATHQAVRPCRTDTEGLPEHANVTFFGGASNEHDMASKRTLRIECEVTGHAASCWRGFAQCFGSGTMRRDVMVGAPLQFARATDAVALPDFGLPQAIEALDRVLHAVFERRRRTPERCSAADTVG